MAAAPRPPAEDTPAPTAVAVEAVRAALARILVSPDFYVSPRNRDFLGYVVEETIAGRGQRLKAYTIAVQVFHRDASFDAAQDPIVRIEAGKLRRGLEHYYLTSGREDPIRIEIPKGGYAPLFSSVDPGAPPRRDALSARWPDWMGRRTFGLLAMSIGAFLIAGTIWLLLGRPGLENGSRPVAQEAGPAIVVMPLQSLGEGEGAELLATGMTADLIADLMRFDGLSVFVGPLPPSRATDPVAERVAYAVSGAVERTSTRIRVSAQLLDRPTARVLWSQAFERSLSTAEIFDVRHDLASGIVSHLAQPYGIINTDAAARLAGTTPETLFAYDCVQRAFAYRRSFDKAAYPPVRACLEEAVQRDPLYADAWAMLGFAHMDAARFGLVPPAAASGEFTAGLAAAERSVELAPESVRSLQALAALQFINGLVDTAEATQRRAIAMNPNDPESLAQLGWRLVAFGRHEEGVRLLEDAIQRSLVVPNWYYVTLAGGLYFQGQLQAAYEAAQRGAGPCCGAGYALLAICAAALGKDAEASNALAEAVRQAPVLGSDPYAFWSRQGLSQPVIAGLLQALRKAGLRASAPDGALSAG
jgi:TolB-like protein/Tfp pilus assembly protein PilF